MDNELMPLDINLIKELKFQGKHNEARQLIEQFRKSCEKNWNQEKKELISQSYKKRKTQGLCSRFKCKNKREPDKSLCSMHILIHNKYRKRYIAKKR